MVTFDGLDLVILRVPPVPIHLERDMLWDRALAYGADQQLSELLGGPFCRRRSESPAPQVRQVEIRHDKGSRRGTHKMPKTESEPVGASLEFRRARGTEKREEEEQAR